MTVAEVGGGIALLVLGGVAALGTTTYTAPVFNNPGEELVCLVQNAGTLPVTVESELRGPADTLSAAADGEVPPGRTLALAASSAAGSGTCRFRFVGDPASVRGYLLRRDLATGTTRVLLPAFTVRRNMVGTTQTVTPPVRTIGDEVFGCRVHNLSSEAVEIETELLDEDGIVVASSTDNLLAGRYDVTIASLDPWLGAHCRFTVTAHGDEVRGYAVLYGTGSAADVVLAAAPADEIGTATALSPPVSSVAGDGTACIAQNLDTIGVIVSAELVRPDGTVVDDGMQLIPPGEVAQIAGTTEAGLHMVCRFTFEDPTDQVRGFISRFPPGLARNTDLLEAARPPGGLAAPETTTISPPLRVGSAGYLQCAAVNLTAAEISAEYAIDDGSGAIVAMVETGVPAGRATAALAEQELTDGFCTFTFDGSPEDLRGYAALTNATMLRTTRVFAALPPGPSPTPTATASPTATFTSSPRPTFTRTPTPSATVTATLAATRTATATASATPTPSATRTATPVASPTSTASSLATATGTVTAPASSSPTATATAAASDTTTPSATPDVPSSATATASATPTSPAGGPCTGDCDGDGAVAIDELITLVNIALDLAALAQCPVADANGDGAIAIDELIAAVRHALDGCGRA